MTERTSYGVCFGSTLPAVWNPASPYGLFAKSVCLSGAMFSSFTRMKLSRSYRTGVSWFPKNTLLINPHFRCHMLPKMAPVLVVKIIDNTPLLIQNEILYLKFHCHGTHRIVLANFLNFLALSILYLYPFDLYLIIQFLQQKHHIE